MRELVYYVAVSLDGRIAGPDGDFSSFLVEGDHMAWQFEHYADALPAPALAAFGIEADRSRFSTVLMGWNTYAVGLPMGLTDPYPHLEQVVVTRAHATAEVPPGVRLVPDDPAEEVDRLKKEDGGAIWLCGGGRLAGALADRIDRLVLKLQPVVLGEAGIPLFGGGAWPGHLRLVDSRRFQSGVIVNEYVS